MFTESNRKKLIEGLVTVIAIAFLAILLLHENQFANPQDELIKKTIATVIVLVSLVLFYVLLLVLGVKVLSLSGVLKLGDEKPAA